MSEIMKNYPFKESEEKVHRTEYLDGLAFIFLGIILLLFAVVINLGTAFIGLLGFSFILAIPLSELLRKRFTYPRLGYFKIKTEKTKNVLPQVLLFVITILAMSIVIIFILESGKQQDIYDLVWEYLPLIFGLIMFGPSLEMVDKTGQSRYYILGIFSTILGLIMTILEFPDLKNGFFLYLVVLGSISFLIGIIMFYRFLQKYPLLNDDENHNNKDYQNVT